MEASLLLHRFDDSGMAMSQIGYGNSGNQVQPALSVRSIEEYTRSTLHLNSQRKLTGLPYITEKKFSGIHDPKFAQRSYTKSFGDSRAIKEKGSKTGEPGSGAFPLK